MNIINPENNSINHWVSFKKGNEKSFKYLFNEYYPVLINYGHRFTSSKFIIEESVQDLFVKFWNNRINLCVPADLPFAYVHDLQIHPRDNMIIIATHGRGMFVLDANPVNGKNK